MFIDLRSLELELGDCWRSVYPLGAITHQGDWAEILKIEEYFVDKFLFLVDVFDLVVGVREEGTLLTINVHQ